MTADQFISLFNNNIGLFAVAMTVMCGVLYFSVRSVAPAGYLDPLHFYWTFTFGTAYGVVVSLYWLNYIDLFYFLLVAGYGITFLVSFRVFLRVKPDFIRQWFVAVLIPWRGFLSSRSAWLAILSYAALLTIVIGFVGFGMFADTNRFEQNRGFGALVRAADALRLFAVAYLSLKAIEAFRRKRRITAGMIGMFGFVAAGMVLGSMANGSKYSLLEAIYSVALAVTICFGKQRFRLSYAISVFVVALSFALIVLSANLASSDVDLDDKPMTFVQSVLVDRFVLRVLANADKYYLTLPDGVIEKLATDNVLTRFVVPLVGTGVSSAFLGYSANDFDVGRQALLYYDPLYEIAGGPTSHFDLFAYKYLGLIGGWLWVVILGLYLASVQVVTRAGRKSMYYSALAAALWVRALPVLLEPSVGIAYVFDIFILFLFFRIVAVLIPTRGDLVNKASS